MPRALDRRKAFDRGQHVTPDQIAAIRKILLHYPDLPNQLERASQFTGYTQQIMVSLRSVTSLSSRNVARAVYLH